MDQDGNGFALFFAGKHWLRVLVMTFLGDDLDTAGLGGGQRALRRDLRERPLRGGGGRRHHPHLPLNRRFPRPYPAPQAMGRGTLTRGPAGVGAPADLAGMRPSGKAHLRKGGTSKRNPPPVGGGSKEGPTPKGTSIGGGDCLGLRATVGKPKARPYRNLNKHTPIATHRLQPLALSGPLTTRSQPRQWGSRPLPLQAIPPGHLPPEHPP